MDHVTATGLIGGALTTGSLLPQAIKAWRTKSTADVSLWMLVLLAVGFLFWITYGFMIGSVPVVLANIASLALTVVILVLKATYNGAKPGRLR